MKTYSRIRSFSLIKLLFICIALTIISCKKDDEEMAAFETSTVMDIDGNVYKTIKIGSQWWMAEDLRVMNFSDGTPVADGQQSSDWLDTIPSYCLFKNDPASPGLLYNWAAVTSPSKLAPEGWRIPTDTDWKRLEEFLGMSSMDASKSGWRGTDEGNKLKLSGSTGWLLYKDNWPTNSSGFSATAGGCRLPDGRFGDPALFAEGFWWTATPSDIKNVYYRYLDYKSAAIYRSALAKGYGLSIRCIKN